MDGVPPLGASAVTSPGVPEVPPPPVDTPDTVEPPVELGEGESAAEASADPSPSEQLATETRAGAGKPKIASSASMDKGARGPEPFAGRRPKTQVSRIERGLVPTAQAGKITEPVSLPSAKVA